MSYEESWISLSRKVAKKGWYKNSQYVHLWIHLLLLANFEEHEFMWNGKIEKLKPGQFITGRNKLSIDTGIPETTIERILNLFEKEAQIGQQKNNKFRLITIRNWGKYQKADNRRTSSGHLADTYNNITSKQYIVDSPNGSPTVTSKPMNYEELNDGEVTYDSEDNPKKKDTFGRFPARISVEYCKLTGNNKASAHLKAGKELMRLALKEYPEDTQEQHFTEIVSRMKIAKIHYENLPTPIYEWSLGKVVEKWDKILSEWYQENLKLKK